MSEPAAILATFSDLKLIRGRKVAQLVFEVPIEEAQKATNALGFPNAAAEKWCAIALTNLAGGSIPKHSVEDHIVSRDTSPAKPRTPSQRAAYLCTKPKFWSFLNTLRQSGFYITDVAGADFALKSHLGIASKTELDSNDLVAGSFEQFEGEFKAWAYGS